MTPFKPNRGKRSKEFMCIERWHKQNTAEETGKHPISPGKNLSVCQLRPCPFPKLTYRWDSTAHEKCGKYDVDKKTWEFTPSCNEVVCHHLFNICV
mmetsp:Transcript_91885/g.210490  ORF Transcript_91885/g.210490 Transcript_91885/m.210490 type:complete len:96 (-) Transcript_91885:66-353(-)